MSKLASLDWRRYVTAFVAMFLALSSGYLMQNILVDEDSDGVHQTTTDASQSLPKAPGEAFHPVELLSPQMPKRTEEVGSIWRESAADCAVTLKAKPVAAATLDVQLNAPCVGGQVVRFSHGKLEFDMKAASNGQISLQIPALESQATVTASVAGKIHSVETQVSESSEYRKVVLIWEGQQIFSVHAYEFGARRNQFGHVWSGSPKSVERAANGRGGYLARLGDGSGKTASVYTFPASHVSMNGVIRLVAEAKVSADNCGQQAEALALQTDVLGQVRATEVNVSLPGCDAIGQTVELKNLLHDMKLASR